MAGNKNEADSNLLTPASIQPFFTFIIKDKTCLRYLKISIVITFIYFIAFKFLYPIGSYFWDSDEYIQVASLHLEANTHPLGYSYFISFFHAISHSDTLLIFAQYVSNVVANLFLFFTLLYFFPLKKWYKAVLFLLLIRNPLYIIFSNYVMSDAFFCSFSVMWFTILLWIMYRPRWIYFFIQLILLYWLFTMRYVALTYPFFVVAVYLLSKQAAWKKIVCISLTFLVIIVTVNSTIHKTEKATGVAVFSAFSGWQLANNAWFVLKHVEPDSNIFHTDASKEIYRGYRHFYDSLKTEDHFDPDAVISTELMWGKYSPLMRYRDRYAAQYFAEHPPPIPIVRYVFNDSTDTVHGMREKKIQPQYSIAAWTLVGSALKDFGIDVIKKYPLEYLRYYVWPNLKFYFKPPLELYDFYNNSIIVTPNGNTLGLTETEYYHYPSKYVDQTYAGLLPVLMWPWNWLVTLINILLILLTAAYYLMRRYKNDAWFSRCLIFYLVFYLADFALNTLTAINFIRYRLVVITLSMVFIVYLWQRVFGSKKRIEPASGDNELTQQPAPEAPGIATTTPEPLWDKMNGWLKKHITWVVFILILSWVGVRALYYNSMVKSPLYSLYLFDQSDNKFFNDWAQYLNKDWLNANPFHPYHWWHKAFADYYLKNHPDKLNEILAARTGNDASFNAGKVLWDEWYHGNQYHQEPLYSYLLAVFYYFNIDAVNLMLILQLMLGVLSGVLLFYITRKYFGETVAVLTGVLYLLCGILMYNEIILLRTSWVVFLTILNVVVIDRTFSNQKPLNFFLCGLCIGFSFLMQSTFALFLIAVPIITFFDGKKKLVSYIKNSGVLILGFFILFSSVIVRNIVVGAPVFSISSVGPVTFIASNVYGTNSITEWSPSPERDAELVGQANKNLSGAINATLKTYPSLTSYCYLEWKKLKAVWKGIEYPNNEDYYFYKQYIPVLQYTNFNFYWIAPFALAGLLLCIYYRKRYYALYLAVAVQLITLLAFYVLARLRAPLVILSLPLAAFAIVEYFRVWFKKRYIIMSEIGTLGIFMFCLLSSNTTSLDYNMLTDGNYRVLYATYFDGKLKEYAANKQWDKWLQLQKQFIDMAPDYVTQTKADGLLPRLNYVYVAQDFLKMHRQREKIYNITGDKFRATGEDNIIDTLNYIVANSFKGLDPTQDIDNFDKDAYYNRGLLYSMSHKNNSAIADFTKAIELDPTYAEAYNNRALAYLNNGDINLALDDLNKAIALNIDSANCFYNRGIIYANRFNKKDLAIADFTKTIAIDSIYSPAYNNRGLCYVYMGEPRLALDDFNKAIALDTDNANAYSNRAFLYYSLGKTDSVLADCSKAIIHDPASALYHYNRALFYKTNGQYDYAIWDFTSGINLKPPNVEIYYYMRALCYVGLQNYDKAIADFSEDIKLDPLMPDYCLNRSLAESKAGQNGAAKADALKARQLAGK